MKGTMTSRPVPWMRGFFAGVALLYLSSASATTHAPPPWRRIVRAIGQQQQQQQPQASEHSSFYSGFQGGMHAMGAQGGRNPIAGVGYRGGVDIGDLVRQQALQQMEALRQQWERYQQNQHDNQPQGRRNQAARVVPQHPLEPRPEDWKARPLMENLGSELLQSMQAFSQGASVPPPVLPAYSGAPVRPFHHGVAKVAIAQTNHDFAIPQDPSKVGGFEAWAMTAGSRTGKTPAEDSPPGIIRAEENTVEPEVKEPSKCVWAIVSCCTPQTEKVRYSCFELLGCPGAFWDRSPCEESVAASALQHAVKYYKHHTVTTTRSPPVEVDEDEDDFR